jgi:hypothetical protein
MRRSIAYRCLGLKGVIPLRSIVSWMLVCAQLAGSVGFPSFHSNGKDKSRPYPCMDRPCGCASYDECWAGDCCCFTLTEKIAWAKANAIVPPQKALDRAACSKSQATCPHCKQSPEPVAVTWSIGILAQKCKGSAFAGLGLLPVAIPPASPFALEFASTASSRLPLVNCLPNLRPIKPDAPPPRI